MRCLSSKSFASLLFTSPSTSALTPLLALRALSLWDSTPLPGLAIHVSDAPEESYDADDQVFVRGNLAIDATGVAMRDQARSFQIAYHELLIGDIIGKGSSSVVAGDT